MNKSMESYKLGELFEWDKWREEIPFINFPERFEVKIIPPFAGAVARFQIRDKEYRDTWVSVYLDCYDALGYYGEPYWEIYPYNEDVYRCRMNDIDELIEVITLSIDNQISSNIVEKVKDNKSKFYTYSQNNSGGWFENNENVCEYVIIEAKSAEHANNIAESIGIYFDGCSDGIDCSCCGDRWYEQCDDKNGEDEPMIYGKSVHEMTNSLFRSECIVHYLDGRKERVKFK